MQMGALPSTDGKNLDPSRYHQPGRKLPIQFYIQHSKRMRCIVLFVLYQSIYPILYHVIRYYNARSSFDVKYPMVTLPPDLLYSN
jgi:hypothetical protein